MLMSGQSNRIWHYFAGRFPGSVGVLVGPSYKTKVPIDDWMPFVLDNDAFTCWKHKKPWDEPAWKEMLVRIKRTQLEPLWAVVPDVVADPMATIASWWRHVDTVRAYRWKCAFAVQDGMTPDDVPDSADVVFVGGTDGWKFPNLKMWTDNFPRVHCARVASEEMLCACERLGCESIDSTAWFRAPDRPDHVPMLRRFIEGHRDQTQEMSIVLNT